MQRQIFMTRAEVWAHFRASFAVQNDPQIFSQNSSQFITPCLVAENLKFHLRELLEFWGRNIFADAISETPTTLWQPDGEKGGWALSEIVITKTLLFFLKLLLKSPQSTLPKKSHFKSGVTEPRLLLCNQDLRALRPLTVLKNAPKPQICQKFVPTIVV